MKKLFFKFVGVVARFMSLFAKPEDLMDDQDLAEIEAKLKDGYCLLSHTNYELTNFFIPGFWTHAAIYYQGNIYEAVTAGVRKTSLSEFVYKKDFVGVFEAPPNFDVTKMPEAIEYIATLVNRPYDWNFVLGSDATLYCSELAYFFYQRCTPGFDDWFKCTSILGSEIATPTDISKNLKMLGKW